MVVKIRLQPGRIRLQPGRFRITRRQARVNEAVQQIRRRNGRAARLSAILLTLVAVCLASFGGWRVAEDLGWTNDFVISEGLFSHWQVWFALAVVAQLGAWRLLSYARVEDPESEPTESVI